MSIKKQIILLETPQVIQADRPETYEVDGFTCPECRGRGWHLTEPFNDYHKEPCHVCGGTGEVCADVTVRWRKKEARNDI